MKSVEQAVQERLVRRRQAQKEAESEGAAQAAIVEANEQTVVELFRDIVEKAINVSLAGLDIRSRFDEGRNAFSVVINFKRGMIGFDPPVTLITENDKPSLEIASSQKKAVWHATYRNKNDTTYVDYEDLLDAIIYATHGAGYPKEEELC